MTKRRYQPSRGTYERVAARVAAGTLHVAACPPPRREGDENLCVTCRLRWPVDEEKPKCPK